MVAEQSFVVDYSSVRSLRTIVVVDLVESVRLIEHHEEETIARWRAFVGAVVAQVLPAHQGRLVKSLGDGMMLEFAGVLEAVDAAFDIQRMSQQGNRDLPADRRLLLRLGVHVSSVITDELDVYGHGVNLAARLASLAGAGEIVASADVRDLLTPMLDADVEDLGDCFLKHVSKPLRAYRIGPPGEKPVVEAGGRANDLRATVAVIPFTARSGDAKDAVLGQVLADDVISALSQSPEVNVISRLSTSVFQGRDLGPAAIGGHLQAHYVVSGSFAVDGDKLMLKVELAHVQTMKVAWAAELKGSVKGVVAGADPITSRLVTEACAAMTLHELTRSHGKSPATLEAHTLLLSSVTLMHRMSPLALERARQLLQALIDRTPRLASPYAWLAKLHVLRVTQGWSGDVQDDGRVALDNTRRALDLDATSSLAMTVEGQVNTYILKRLDVAQQRYEAALTENPNDSLALLLKGTMHAFRDEGEEAVRLTRHALQLSPLDPLRYYFNSLAAAAALSAGNYDDALSLAESSLRLNRIHASTLRAMIAALWNLGRSEEARARVVDLLALEPSFTVSAYLQRSPAADFSFGRNVADALRNAGVPS